MAKHLRSVWPSVVLIGVDTGFYAHCLFNPPALPEYLIDIQHFSDVRHMSPSILENIDCIVHLAALSNDPIGNTFEKLTYDINYQASVSLAEKAKEAGVRSFVFASSCSVYGSADNVPREETHALNPLTAYAKSKILTEKELMNLADDAFTVTCLRFSTACGMSDRLRLDLVLNDFVASAFVQKKIEILSDGTPWRPLIDVKDMARAIEWALLREPQCGGDFLSINIGSDQWNYRVSELAEAVAEAIPDTIIITNKKAQPDRRSYKVNFNLFKQLAPAKYQPQLDLRTTIANLAEGLNMMKFDDRNFRKSGYVRLNCLSELRHSGLLNDSLEWAQRQKW